MLASWRDIEKILHETDAFGTYGRLIRVKGLLLECSAHAVSVGDLCYIETEARRVPAEVVGFNAEKVQIMPFEVAVGLKAGDKVCFTNHKLAVGVGDSLLGRVIDPLGVPLDAKGSIEVSAKYAVFGQSINPMERPLLNRKLAMGIKVLDGFLPIAEGQRVGIFSGTGVGKTSLLGMVAHNSDSEVNVIAMIGERGREVREFVEKELGEQGLQKSVIVVSTSDTTAVSRFRGAFTALAVAEYFRDQGKKVMLLFDSMTRFANAGREIGLSLGEPPSSRGYPPSVFAILPLILERCGAWGKGSITGIFTVLTEGEDMDEPVADAIRGILDGHIVLDRKIAEKGIYPAVNVLSSVSRLQGRLLEKTEKEKLMRIRSLLSLYVESQDLIKAGIYVKGTDKDLDLAISLKKSFDLFMAQDLCEKISQEETQREIDILYEQVCS